MRPRHFSFVVLAATLWGTGGALGHALARDSAVPSVAVAMWRILLAGLVLAAVLQVLGRLRLRAVTPAMWRRAAVMAVFLAVFQAAYFAAVDRAGVGLATMVTIGSSPLAVAAFDVVVRRHRPSARTVAALALALAGLVALTGGAAEAGGGSHAIAGVGLALVAGGAFAGVSIVASAAVPEWGGARLTAVAFTGGGLTLLPLALATGWGVPSSTTGWVLVGALAVIATAIPHALFNAGLATVPAVIATIVALLEPLVAAVIGVVAFSESLGPWQIVGALALGSPVVVLRPQRDAPVPLA
ncbi:hypothetical protein Lsed01_02160 [Demequina sediminis]|uniref:EamA domain-containing protein n=1 Tax=Demequina sediminis TaxID=1930058 RepID=A0ABP9WIN1_9MICO|nr:DMT family transporter [Demequina sediminis]BDZ60245.1 membrane protein [Demequina sediminis]BDZ63024.1 membrane protein [Demequina sediminis]